MLTPEEQETVDSYNKIAKDWTASQQKGFWNLEYQKFHEFLPGGKIIDIGCGGGRDAEWFVANGYDYTGIDASASMIELAKAKKLQAQFLVCDFYRLKFARNSYDGFWAACSLVHVPKNELGSVLDQIKKIIKRGAIGFIAVKEGSGEVMQEWRDSGQKRFFVYYLQQEFQDILENKGFKILEKSRRPPGQFKQDSTFMVYFVKAI